jgi:hypothetical protein
VTLIHRARQRLTATPDVVELKAPPGQPFPSRIFLIRDNQNQKIVIDEVLADDPAVTCRWAGGPGLLATVKIQVDRAKLSGKSLQTAVHVHVREPVREVVSIPVTCVIP